MFLQDYNDCKCACWRGGIFIDNRAVSNPAAAWSAGVVPEWVPIAPNVFSDRYRKPHPVILDTSGNWLAPTTRPTVASGGSLTLDLNATFIAMSGTLFPAWQVAQNLFETKDQPWLPWPGWSEVNSAGSVSAQSLTAGLFDDAAVAGYLIEPKVWSSNQAEVYHPGIWVTNLFHQAAIAIVNPGQTGQVRVLAKHLLTLNGQRRLILPPAPRLEMPFQTLSTTVEVDNETGSRTMAVTAISTVPSNVGDTSSQFTGVPSHPGMTWGDPIWVNFRYHNVPLQGLTGTYPYLAKIYRDGELVASVSRAPTSPMTSKDPDWFGPFAEHTSEEGSYLIEFGAQFGAIQGFLSFAIDKTPPRIVTQQVDDYFAGDPTGVHGWWVGSAYLGVPTGAIKINLSCDEPVFKDGIGNQPIGFITEPLRTAPGDYTAAYSGPTPRDRARNLATDVPVAQYTVHQVPSGNKYGARARIKFPGYEDNKNYSLLERNPIQPGPATHFTIEFDKPVFTETTGGGAGSEQKPATASDIVQMITITGTLQDGTAATIPTGDLTLERSPVYPGIYALGVPAGPQAWNSRWLLEFKPSANLKAKVGSGFEDCVLASRYMWCIAQDPSVGREVINTGLSGAFLGRVPSLTDIIEVEQSCDKDAATITAGTDVCVNAGIGEFSTADHVPYVPCLPPSLSAPTNVPHSYFGLPYTFHQSQPKEFPSNGFVGQFCAAPEVPQKHSSLIIGSNELTGLTIDLPKDASFLTYILAPQVRVFPTPGPFIGSSSIEGEQSSQSLWSGNAGGQERLLEGYSSASGPNGATQAPVSLDAGELASTGTWPKSRYTYSVYYSGSETFYGHDCPFHIEAGRSCCVYESLKTVTPGNLRLQLNGRIYGTVRSFSATLQYEATEWYAIVLDEEGNEQQTSYRSLPPSCRTVYWEDQTLPAEEIDTAIGGPNEDEVVVFYQRYCFGPENCYWQGPTFYVAHNGNWRRVSPRNWNQWTAQFFAKAPPNPPLNASSSRNLGGGGWTVTASSESELPLSATFGVSLSVPRAGEEVLGGGGTVRVEADNGWKVDVSAS